MPATEIQKRCHIVFFCMIPNLEEGDSESEGGNGRTGVLFGC